MEKIKVSSLHDLIGSIINPGDLRTVLLYDAIHRPLLFSLLMQESMPKVETHLEAQTIVESMEGTSQVIQE